MLSVGQPRPAVPLPPAFPSRPFPPPPRSLAPLYLSSSCAGGSGAAAGRVSSERSAARGRERGQRNGVDTEPSAIKIQGGKKSQSQFACCALFARQTKQSLNSTGGDNPLAARGADSVSLSKKSPSLTYLPSTVGGASAKNEANHDSGGGVPSPDSCLPTRTSSSSRSSSRRRRSESKKRAPRRRRQRRQLQREESRRRGKQRGLSRRRPEAAVRRPRVVPLRRRRGSA